MISPQKRRRFFSRGDKFTLGFFIGIPTILHLGLVWFPAAATRKGEAEARGGCDRYRHGWSRQEEEEGSGAKDAEGQGRKFAGGEEGKG